MIWEDFLISRQLTTNEIIQWAQGVFSIPTELIAVTSECALESTTDDILVACETETVIGDFAMRISVSVRREDLEMRDAKQAVSKLCQTFEVSALVPDDGANPYRMIHFDTSGSHRPIHLNTEELDENENYVIHTYEDATGLEHQWPK